MGSVGLAGLSGESVASVVANVICTGATVGASGAPLDWQPVMYNKMNKQNIAKFLWFISRDRLSIYPFRFKRALL
jgi:hypothetical protein